MSECSDAYYLLNADRNAARRLLRSVGRFALLMQSSGRWVPALIEGPLEAGGPIDGFGEHAAGPWMHYAYAEDHGIWLTFFVGPREVSRLELQRRGPSEVDIDSTSRMLLEVGFLETD